MRGRIERWLEPYEADSVSDLVTSAYQIPTILLLMGFMFWTRIRSFDNFVRGDEVFFSGNDAYYHYREVSYIVENWPWTMPFDPWTQFPYGTSADQFGTLYDQLVATAALLIGLGDPTPDTVALTLLVAPAVLGALVAIPVYFLGKRMAGRPGGVFAVFLIALLPGAFFQRSTVGFSDHHVAEVLLQSTAVLTTMIALTVAEREKPVYEQFLDRDWTGLREPLTWSAIAGVAIGLYFWTWPPAVVLVGVLGVFYLLALSYETSRGRSPEHLAFVGVVSLSVAFVMTALKLDTFTGFGVTTLSLLQLLLIGAVAAGCAFMAGLARVWEARRLPQQYYPVAIGVLVASATLAVSIILPRLFRSIVRNSLSTFGFGQTDTVLTIREAQAVPFNELGSFMFSSYGLLFLTAAGGLISLIWHVSRSESYKAEHLLVIVWAVFTTLMALTQIRFNYYLAVVVAVLNVWAFSRVAPLLDLPRRANELDELKNYQVIALLIVVFIVIVPLAPPVASAGVISGGENVGPGSVVVWDESLDWMANHTPPEGTYGDANQPMAYYGTFERTDDFAYPEGAYGVMSWWDYGHWITVEGERIPVANPFQANARPASAFLLADSEEHANLILEAMPSDKNVDERSPDELRGTVASQNSQEAGEDTRYVIIDDQMAAGKFSAIATWTGDGPGQYFSQQEFQVAGSEAQLVGTNDRYEDTMLAKLYLQDAQGLSHYRLVHESGDSAIVSVAQRTPQGFQSTNFINQRLTQGVLTTVQQRQDLFFYNIRQEAAVKTFERVPGATLTGQVVTDNATTVFATVRLQTNRDRNFTYVQSVQTDSDGRFEVTVPYATTDTVGPDEGGTDSAVEAVGQYELFAGNPIAPSARGNTSVPEPAIYDGETITVEMETVEQDSGNESAGNGSSEGNESALVFPTGSGPTASLDAPDGPAGLTFDSPTLAEPRRAADG